ncbi:Microtubule-Associated Serine/Threonine-Protein Kinase 1 [Manis pentadactyla]|nr:Microtubule-Associated Serine/Threonine-Protein Kinase 1 [Manis pentadactyla]
MKLLSPFPLLWTRIANFSAFSTPSEFRQTSPISYNSSEFLPSWYLPLSSHQPQTPPRVPVPETSRRLYFGASYQCGSEDKRRTGFSRLKSSAPLRIPYLVFVDNGQGYVRTTGHLSDEKRDHSRIQLEGSDTLPSILNVDPLMKDQTWEQVCSLL